MAMWLFLLSFILVINLKAQEKTEKQRRLDLTSVSKDIVSEFIHDDMNTERIDSLSSSIVLSFGDVADADVDLTLYDDELLYSCLNHKYVAKYMGYCIFYQGMINSKYIEEVTSLYDKNNCSTCDSLVEKVLDKSSVIFKEYDGSVYKIYKSDRGRKVKIVKIPGG